MKHQNQVFRISVLTSLFLVFTAINWSCESKPGTKAIEDPYNGIRKTYRKDGSLLAEVAYKDSIRDGKSINYYPSGKVNVEMNYVKGKKHGDAISYYENGDVYVVTPYVNGKREGLEKKYYKGGKLMSEMSFKNDKPLPGLKEYSEKGKQINKDVKIVFSLVDQTAFEDRFDLKIRLSDNSRNAKFFRVYPPENGKDELVVDINTKNGVAVIPFHVFPGKSYMEKLHIKAERLTRKGNNEAFKATYNLAVENPKKLRH